MSVYERGLLVAVGFASYEIARSGMLVNERGLYVTGHNISNVNTVGYVRQQAIFRNGPLKTESAQNGVYQIGLGSDIQEIRQIRHLFLDNIYRRENTTLGYWESRSKTVQDIESILGEPMGEGLQNVMNQFYDSWQELSKEPDSLTVRALVRQRGNALVQHINHMGEQLERLQNDLNSEVKIRIDELNSISMQISKLNIEILKNEVSGDSANDFRDQRNLLIDRLTKLINAEIVEMQDGQVDITVGGYFLVNKGLHGEVYAEEPYAGAVYQVPKLRDGGILVPLKSGIIKGLLESRGEVNGTLGSLQNGTPGTKADIVVAVDTSDTSAVNLAKIKANIASFTNELKMTGLDYNLRLVTFDGTGAIETGNYGSNTAAFIGAVNQLSPSVDSGNDFNSLSVYLGGITDFRRDSLKFTYLFTGESISGDGTAAITPAEADAMLLPITANNIKLSVFSNPAYFFSGDPGTGESVGWSYITSPSNGRLYDMDTVPVDFGEIMKKAANDIHSDINESISKFDNTLNILPDLKKRINALINIFAGEVNYLHKSGCILGDSAVPGSDFFVPINSARPMELGNITLNSKLFSLNEIVASKSGEDGDNTIALAISNLRHKELMSDTSGVLSFDEYYQAIILNIANLGADSMRIAENQKDLVNSTDSYRLSVTGVSMDEEMSNMLKFKFAYNASSRLINVIDEMLDTIISRTGLSGR